MSGKELISGEDGIIPGHKFTVNTGDPDSFLRIAEGILVDRANGYLPPDPNAPKVERRAQISPELDQVEILKNRPDVWLTARGWTKLGKSKWQSPYPNDQKIYSTARAVNYQWNKENNS